VISIVLPIHNQGGHLRDVIEGYAGELDKLGRPHEVVLVNNACTDQSLPVSYELARERGNLQVLELAEGGWGRAVRAGLRAAEGETLCYTNSARTTPQMLTLMLLYADAYPGIVLKANRTIRDNWRRRLGSLLYNLECRRLFGLPVWDINGTPKVFPRSFDKLLALTRDDDLIDLEFIVVCRREGYPLVEVPILATQRHGGRSTTSYRSAARMYWQAYRLSRRGVGGPQVGPLGR
jgi:glycosyltransferase involved in cell wall biosynthesis